MKKSTKGAIAAGAAAVLLTGGAGTLAFWTATDDIDAGSINGGELTLTAADCADVPWLDAANDSVITLLVPGDSVYKICDVTIDGEGENLQASVAVDQDSVADLDFFGDDIFVAAEATDPVAGDVVDVDGETPVEVRVTVDWDFGVENNDSNGMQSADLDAITLIATQADPN